MNYFEKVGLLFSAITFVLFATSLQDYWTHPSRGALYATCGYGFVLFFSLGFLGGVVREVMKEEAEK